MNAVVIGGSVAALGGGVVTSGTSGNGYVGTTHPLVLIDTAYSPSLLSNIASDFATPTATATKHRNFLNATLAYLTGGSENDGPGWYFATLYAAQPTYTDPTSGYNYGNSAINNPNNGASQWAGSDAYGVIGGLMAFIAQENTYASTYTGSSKLPLFCSDQFYNSRNVYVDVALIFDWCYPLLTSGQKTTIISYYNNALTLMWSASPTLNGHSIPASYALKDASLGVDPRDNYFYGHLLATMLGYAAFGSDNASGSTWRTNFRTTMVDGYLTSYLSGQTGGGGKEGTGYGLADYLLAITYDWWLKSTGEDLFALTPTYWANRINWWAHASTPDGKYIMNWGDHARDSTSAMFDYYRTLMLPVMSHFPASATSQAMNNWLTNNCYDPIYGGYLARNLHDQNVGWDTVYRDVPGIGTANVASTFGKYWKDDGSGYLMMRTGWTASDTAIYYSYGQLLEGHDHCDKGSFSIYSKTYLAADQNLNTHGGEWQGTDVVNMVSMLSGTVQLTPLAYGNGTAPTVNFWVPLTTSYYYLSTDLTSQWPSPVTKNKRELMFFPVGSSGVLVVFDYITTSTSYTARWQWNTPYNPTISTTTNSNDTVTVAGLGSVTAKGILIEPTSTGFAKTAWPSMGAETQSGGAQYVPLASLLSDVTSLYSAQANTAFSGSSATSGYRTDCSLTGTSAVFLTVIDIGGNLTSAVQGTNSAGIHTATLTFSGALGTKHLTFYEATTQATVT